MISLTELDIKGSKQWFDTFCCGPDLREKVDIQQLWQDEGYRLFEYLPVFMYEEAKKFANECADTNEVRRHELMVENLINRFKVNNGMNV